MPKRGKSEDVSEDSKDKRSRQQEQQQQFTVWTQFDGDYAKYCVVDTHIEAHARVEALKKEAEAYIAAGGRLPKGTFYFYTNRDGAVFDSSVEDGEVKWKLAVRTDNYRDKGYTSKKEKIGTLIRVDMTKADDGLWGEEHTSSMKFAATEDGGRISIAFWRNILKLDKKVIGVLRKVYTKGDYNNLPTEADLEAEEKELNEEEVE